MEVPLSLLLASRMSVLLRKAFDIHTEVYTCMSAAACKQKMIIINHNNNNNVLMEYTTNI